MTQGQKLSPDMQWVVVRLSRLLRKEQIAIYTGVSIRSIERILESFQKHGTIAESDGKQRSRRKQLCDIDVEVNFNFEAVKSAVPPKRFRRVGAGLSDRGGSAEGGTRGLGLSDSEECCATRMLCPIYESRIGE